MSVLKVALGCVIASALAMPAAAAMPASRTILAEYLHARVADADGEAAAAAKGYAAVLAATPTDTVIATRAYRQAMIAGDQPLALKAANALVAGDMLPPDGRLLLLAEAVNARDWKKAGLLADQVEKDKAFAFVLPVVRAWIAYGAGDSDPVAALDKAQASGGLAAAYAKDHRPLLLLLMEGRRAEGIAAVQALGVTDPGRATRLRLAAAAQVAKTDKARALAMLTGDDAEFAVARRRIEAGEPLPGAVDTAQKGISELFVRIAIDVSRERAAALAIAFARLATFTAPDNDEAWAVTAGLLGASGRDEAALAALDRISPAAPLIDAAAALRVRLLMQRDDLAGALAAAEARAKRADADQSSWAAVGGVYMQMKRPADAVAAYTRALALAAAPTPSQCL
jgi:tetratricopeptide (TPR) repeat protein